MSFILHSRNRTLTVRVNGELDLVSANEFREVVDSALEETVAQNLIIDLSKVTFIDSSGLGVILGRFRKIQARDGRLILTGPKAGVKRMLELAGVLSYLPVCGTEAEAWKIIERKAI